MRIADEDRELSPSELRKIMIGREYEENWENKPAGQTIDDADEDTIKAFYSSATSCGRLPEVEYDKRKILDQLGVLNGNHLTNAGVCLFSSRKPIVLKTAVFATDRKETFLDLDRTEGNIFELIDAAVAYIVKNIRWRVEMSEDGIHRKETPEVPIDAIREAVINSFAHARYDLPVQHEIDIFSNRISICNPGSFANEYEPIDFYTRDIRSYLRNEAIAKTLYLCKDVETFGSGIKKIYTLCNKTGIDVSYINEETAFTLEFSRKDRNASSKSGEIEGKIDSEINGEINGGINGEITKAEQSLLSLLGQSPSMTNAELAATSGKSERTISRLIAELKNKKLIQRVGSNKTGYWKTL